MLLLRRTLVLKNTNEQWTTNNEQLKTLCILPPLPCCFFFQTYKWVTQQAMLKEMQPVFTKTRTRHKILLQLN